MDRAGKLAPRAREKSQLALLYLFGMDTEQIIEALKQERDRISRAISILEGSDGVSRNVNHTGARRRRRVSPEVRARIAAAQRRRWAAVTAKKK